MKILLDRQVVPFVNPYKVFFVVEQPLLVVVGKVISRLDSVINKTLVVVIRSFEV